MWLNFLTTLSPFRFVLSCITGALEVRLENHLLAVKTFQPYWRVFFQLQFIDTLKFVAVREPMETQQEGNVSNFDASSFIASLWLTVLMSLARVVTKAAKCMKEGISDGDAASRLIPVLASWSDSGNQPGSSTGRPRLVLPVPSLLSPHCELFLTLSPLVLSLLSLQPLHPFCLHPFGFGCFALAHRSIFFTSMWRIDPTAPSPSCLGRLDPCGPWSG